MSSDRAVEAYARQQLERLRKSVKQLRRADPTALHDARVATRRLDAALDVLLERKSQASRGKESRALQRLRRRLGRVREREGLSQSLSALLESAPAATREAGERLLDRLAKRILRGRRRSVGRIDARRRAVRALREEAELRQVPDPAALAATAERWSEIRRRDAERWLARAARSHDPADLHRARLAVKKWRYAAEVCALATGVAAERESRHLIELQRCLGAIHDDDVLLEFLRGRSRRWRSRKKAARAAALRPLLRTLAAQRRDAVGRLDVAYASFSAPETSRPARSGSAPASAADG